MPVILPKESGDARKRTRNLRPVRPNRRDRAQYNAALQDLADYLRAQTRNLSDIIKGGADRRTVAAALTEMTNAAQARANAVAPGTAQSFVTSVDAANKAATEAAIARGLSVDFATIIDEPGVRDAVELAIAENSQLIKSIASEHWSKVAQAVLDNYRGVPQPEGVSLAKRLQEMGGITKRRATFIARDQTASLTATLNATRQQSVGIDEYTWRNSQDNRVVGNPGGLYPKGNRRHEDHWTREGNVYKWAQPPGDGHPGQPIGCRCTAEPVLNLDKLKAQYV